MDIASANITRGKIQFDNKTNKKVKYPETLGFLREYFIDHIGVMEIKETLSDELLETGLIPRAESFAAIRMAKVCLELSDEKDICDSFLYAMAIDKYLDLETNQVECNIDNESNNKINVSLMEEIVQANDDDSEELGDINDLIGEIEESELSIEGKRAVGYLPKDFDTLNPNKSDYNLEVNKLPLAILSEDENNNPILSCPNCLSTTLYDKGYSRFTCLDCDTEFKSPFGLWDLLPPPPSEEEEEETEPLHIVAAWNGTGDDDYDYEKENTEEIIQQMIEFANKEK